MDTDFGIAVKLVERAALNEFIFEDEEGTRYNLPRVHIIGIPVIGNRGILTNIKNQYFEVYLIG